MYCWPNIKELIVMANYKMKLKNVNPAFGLLTNTAVIICILSIVCIRVLSRDFEQRAENVKK